MSIDVNRVNQVFIHEEWISVHPQTFQVLSPLTWVKDGTAVHTGGVGYSFNLAGAEAPGRLQLGPLEAIRGVRYKHEH